MQSSSSSLNKKLKESLNLKVQENISEPERAPSATKQDMDSSITDELKAKKRESKKPAKISCMTHLLPNVNQKIEELIEQSGLSKSKVLEHLILKGLNLS
jgi:predicted transcriptional regulator